MAKVDEKGMSLKKTSLERQKKLDLVANEILGERMTESEVIDKYELEISMVRNKR